MMRPVAMAWLAIILAACTTANLGPTSAPPDNDWLLVAHGPPATLAALLSGQLEIDLSSQCVRVIDGRFSIPVVFPEGTTLDDSDPDHPALVLSNGRRYEAGDQVLFGGGGVSVPDNLNDWTGSYSHISIPPACHNGDVWLLSEVQ